MDLIIIIIHLTGIIIPIGILITYLHSGIEILFIMDMDIDMATGIIIIHIGLIHTGIITTDIMAGIMMDMGIPILIKIQNVLSGKDQVDWYAERMVHLQVADLQIIPGTDQNDLPQL